MSDALCGPSNPLQQFKAQTSLDRTLQQDRLRSHASPAHQQGFRSHDPNAGLLDPEFEAFQAGHPPPPQAFHHGPPQAFAGRGGGGMHMGMAMGPAAPDWAADFQRMNLSSPPPPPAQQQHQPMPQGSGWAQSFQQHIAQSAPRAQSTASPSPLAFQQRARYGPGYGGMGFQSQLAPQHQQPMFGAGMHQAKGKEAVTDEIFDDAAFDRAFEQARDDMMDENQVGLDGLQHSTEYRQDTSGELVDQIQREREIQEQLQEMRPELSKGLQDPAIQEANALEDLAQQPEQMEEEKQENKGQDDDALAATAEELLNKVEHNKTDKFKNSQFLGLMRKLRDREVKVEGDQMVETTPSSSSAAAAATSSSKKNHPLSTSPLSKSTATNTTTNPSFAFDNSEQRPHPISPSTNALHGPRIDSRPYDHFTTLPADAQQDADLHRFSPTAQQQQQQPDGQAVVDLLNEPTTSTASDDLEDLDLRSAKTVDATSVEALRQRQRRRRRRERLDSFVRWTACIEDASGAWFGERDFDRMMHHLTTLVDSVRENRNQSFVVDGGGIRDRLETIMEMLQQVEGREEGSGVDRFEGGEGEVSGDPGRVQEAWQGLYEVFRGMRREIGRMSRGV